MEKAIDFIRPDPESYLHASRITDATGVLETLQPRRISGWAFYRKAPNKPVNVRIDINGEREYIVLANRSRPDLKENRIHPTGNRGFVLLLSNQEKLKQGDHVSVRVVGDIVDLKNSPRVFQGNEAQ